MWIKKDCKLQVPCFFSSMLQLCKDRVHWMLMDQKRLQIAGFHVFFFNAAIVQRQGSQTQDTTPLSQWHNRWPAVFLKHQFVFLLSHTLAELFRVILYVRETYKSMRKTLQSCPLTSQCLILFLVRVVTVQGGN